MGIVEKRLGDPYSKAWHQAHPIATKVKLSPQYNFKTAAEMRAIVHWVEENTSGHSTASVTTGGQGAITMVWYFETKSDAVRFKLVWG